MAKKKKENRVLRHMKLYAKIWLSILLVIMIGLWIYLFHYERSQISHAISAYRTQIEKKEVSSQADSVLADLDTTFQTTKEAKEEMKSIIENDLEFHKDVENTTDSVSAYIMKYNGNQIGTVSFKKAKGINIFGFNTWKVDQSSVDLNGLKTSVNICVPDGWTVSVNGKTIDDTHVTSTTIPYTGYESFYDDTNSIGLPTLKQYTSGYVVGSVEYTIVSPANKKIDSSEITDTTFLTEASDDMKQRAESFMPTFLTYYIQCLSNANHDASGNFSAITPYVLEGGNLYTRLYNAIEGQAWANSSGDTLLNTTINKLYEFGNGFYICDVTYDIETVGTEGAVQNSLNAKVLLQATDDSFVAVDLSNY